MHDNTPNIAHNYHHPLHKDTRVIEMNIVLYTQQMRTKRTRLCTAAISSKQLYRIAYWNCDESTANKPYNMKRDDRAKKKTQQPYMKIHKSVWLSGRRLVVIWCNLLDLSKMHIDWNCCTQKQLYVWYEIIWQLTAVSRCIMTTNWWNEWQILQCRHGTFNAWNGNSLIEVLQEANTTE